MRFYVKAQMEFEEDNAFYPDANFTLRVTYGKIEGFKPFDGANYNYFTTLDGVMEKEVNPTLVNWLNGIVSVILKHNSCVAKLLTPYLILSFNLSTSSAASLASIP